MFQRLRTPPVPVFPSLNPLHCYYDHLIPAPSSLYRNTGCGSYQMREAVMVWLFGLCACKVYQEDDARGYMPQKSDLYYDIEVKCGGCDDVYLPTGFVFRAELTVSGLATDNVTMKENTWQQLNLTYGEAGLRMIRGFVGGGRRDPNNNFLWAGTATSCAEHLESDVLQTSFDLIDSTGTDPDGMSVSGYATFTTPDTAWKLCYRKSRSRFNTTGEDDWGSVQFRADWYVYDVVGNNTYNWQSPRNGYYVHHPNATEVFYKSHGLAYSGDFVAMSVWGATSYTGSHALTPGTVHSVSVWSYDVVMLVPSTRQCIDDDYFSTTSATYPGTSTAVVSSTGGIYSSAFYTITQNSVKGTMSASIGTPSIVPWLVATESSYGGGTNQPILYVQLPEVTEATPYKVCYSNRDERKEMRTSAAEQAPGWRVLGNDGTSDLTLMVYPREPSNIVTWASEDLTMESWGVLEFRVPVWDSTALDSYIADSTNTYQQTGGDAFKVVPFSTFYTYPTITYSTESTYYYPPLGCWAEVASTLGSYDLGTNPRQSTSPWYGDARGNFTYGFITMPTEASKICYRRAGDSWRVLEGILYPVPSTTNLTYAVNDTRAGTWAPLTILDTSGAASINAVANTFYSEPSSDVVDNAMAVKLVKAGGNCLQEIAASNTETWDVRTFNERSGHLQSVEVWVLLPYWETPVDPTVEGWLVCVKLGTRNWESIQNPDYKSNVYYIVGSPPNRVAHVQEYPKQLRTARPFGLTAQLSDATEYSAATVTLSATVYAFHPFDMISISSNTTGCWSHSPTHSITILSLTYPNYIWDDPVSEAQVSFVVPPLLDGDDEMSYQLCFFPFDTKNVFQVPLSSALYFVPTPKARLNLTLSSTNGGTRSKIVISGSSISSNDQFKLCAYQADGLGCAASAVQETLVSSFTVVNGRNEQDVQIPVYDTRDPVHLVACYRFSGNWNELSLGASGDLLAVSSGVAYTIIEGDGAYPASSVITIRFMRAWLTAAVVFSYSDKAAIVASTGFCDSTNRQRFALHLGPGAFNDRPWSDWVVSLPNVQGTWKVCYKTDSRPWTEIKVLHRNTEYLSTFAAVEQATFADGGLNASDVSKAVAGAVSEGNIKVKGTGFVPTDEQFKFIHEDSNALCYEDACAGCRSTVTGSDSLLSVHTAIPAVAGRYTMCLFYAKYGVWINVGRVDTVSSFMTFSWNALTKKVHVNDIWATSAHPPVAKPSIIAKVSGSDSSASNDVIRVMPSGTAAVGCADAVFDDIPVVSGSSGFIETAQSPQIGDWLTDGLNQVCYKRSSAASGTRLKTGVWYVLPAFAVHAQNTLLPGIDTSTPASLAISTSIDAYNETVADGTYITITTEVLSSSGKRVLDHVRAVARYALPALLSSDLSCADAQYGIPQNEVFIVEGKASITYQVESPYLGIGVEAVQAYTGWNVDWPSRTASKFVTTRISSPRIFIPVPSLPIVQGAPWKSVYSGSHVPIHGYFGNEHGSRTLQVQGKRVKVTFSSANSVEVTCTRGCVDRDISSGSYFTEMSTAGMLDMEVLVLSTLRRSSTVTVVVDLYGAEISELLITVLPIVPERMVVHSVAPHSRVGRWESTAYDAQHVHAAVGYPLHGGELYNITLHLVNHAGLVSDQELDPTDRVALSSNSTPNVHLVQFAMRTVVGSVPMREYIATVMPVRKCPVAKPCTIVFTLAGLYCSVSSSVRLPALSMKAQHSPPSPVAADVGRSLGAWTLLAVDVNDEIDEYNYGTLHASVLDCCSAKLYGATESPFAAGKATVAALYLTGSCGSCDIIFTNTWSGSYEFRDIQSMDATHHLTCSSTPNPAQLVMSTGTPFELTVATEAADGSGTSSSLPVYVKLLRGAGLVFSPPAVHLNLGKATFTVQILEDCNPCVVEARVERMEGLPWTYENRTATCNTGSFVTASSPAATKYMLTSAATSKGSVSDDWHVATAGETITLRLVAADYFNVTDPSYTGDSKRVYTVLSTSIGTALEGTGGTVNMVNPNYTKYGTPFVRGEAVLEFAFSKACLKCTVRFVDSSGVMVEARAYFTILAMATRLLSTSSIPVNDTEATRLPALRAYPVVSPWLPVIEIYAVDADGVIDFGIEFQLSLRKDRGVGVQKWACHPSTPCQNSGSEVVSSSALGNSDIAQRVEDIARNLRGGVKLQLAGLNPASVSDSASRRDMWGYIKLTSETLTSAGVPLTSFTFQDATYWRQPTQASRLVTLSTNQELNREEPIYDGKGHLVRGVSDYNITEMLPGTVFPVTVQVIDEWGYPVLGVTGTVTSELLVPGSGCGSGEWYTGPSGLMHNGNVTLWGRVKGPCEKCRIRYTFLGSCSFDNCGLPERFTTTDLPITIKPGGPSTVVVVERPSKATFRLDESIPVVLRPASFQHGDVPIFYPAGEASFEVRIVNARMDRPDAYWVQSGGVITPSSIVVNDTTKVLLRFSRACIECKIMLTVLPSSSFYLENSFGTAFSIIGEPTGAVFHSAPSEVRRGVPFEVVLWHVDASGDRSYSSSGGSVSLRTDAMGVVQVIKTFYDQGSVFLLLSLPYPCVTCSLWLAKETETRVSFPIYAVATYFHITSNTTNVSITDTVHLVITALDDLGWVDTSAGGVLLFDVDGNAQGFETTAAVMTNGSAVVVGSLKVGSPDSVLGVGLYRSSLRGGIRVSVAPQQRPQLSITVDLYVVAELNNITIHVAFSERVSSEVHLRSSCLCVCGSILVTGDTRTSIALELPDTSDVGTCEVWAESDESSSGNHTVTVFRTHGVRVAASIGGPVSGVPEVLRFTAVDESGHIAYNTPFEAQLVSATEGFLAGNISRRITGVGVAEVSLLFVKYGACTLVYNSTLDSAVSTLLVQVQEVSSLVLPHVADGYTGVALNVSAAALDADGIPIVGGITLTMSVACDSTSTALATAVGEYSNFSFLFTTPQTGCRAEVSFGSLVQVSNEFNVNIKASRLQPLNALGVEGDENLVLVIAAAVDNYGNKKQDFSGVLGFVPRGQWYGNTWGTVMKGGEARLAMSWAGSDPNSTQYTLVCDGLTRYEGSITWTRVTGVRLVGDTMLIVGQETVIMMETITKDATRHTGDYFNKFNISAAAVLSGNLSAIAVAGLMEFSILLESYVEPSIELVVGGFRVQVNVSDGATSTLSLLPFLVISLRITMVLPLAQFDSVVFVSIVSATTGVEAGMIHVTQLCEDVGGEVTCHERGAAAPLQQSSDTALIVHFTVAAQTPDEVVSAINAAVQDGESLISRTYAITRGAEYAPPATPRPYPPGYYLTGGTYNDPGSPVSQAVAIGSSDLVFLCAAISVAAFVFCHPIKVQACRLKKLSMSIHDANEVVPFITGTDLIKPELSGKRVCIAGTVIAHDAVSNVVQAEDSDHKLFEVRLSPGFSASHHMLFSGTLHPGHAGSACLATIICDGFSCYVTDMNTQLIDALKETIAINRRYPELFGNPIHG